MKCTLPKDVNNCSFCDKTTMLCLKEDKCSFQVKESKPEIRKTEYIRKERWYEKYYRERKSQNKEEQ